ncbi:unnamed protein product [Caenorhabditis bovis]|uniref:Cystatin domain-containing protein n=1 Tax=Caenorhabditis bovis TaxID=2654633 RepID=A0A8S1ELJ0_9PELO|nr:unnamed protein product [Caenorhabditis bovis]
MFKLFVFVLIVDLTIAAGIPGGPIATNPDDEEIQNVAWKATPNVNAEINENYYYVPVKVTSATSQVVSGIMYRLKVIYGQSDCLRSENLDRNQCAYNGNGNTVVYDVSLWSQPWTNFEQITVAKEATQ